MRTQKSNIGQITLRARWFFFAILILLLGSGTGSVVAGVKSGELEEKVVQPVLGFWEGMKVKIEPKPEPKITPRPTITPWPTAAPKSRGGFGGGYRFATPTSYPTYDYDKAGRESSELFKQAQEESRKRSEEWERESDARMEEFRKQGEEKMRQAELEGQQGLEEFREKYGN